MIGHPMHAEAARVLDELGGDPSGFAGRQLTQKVASNADLVLALTRAHRDAVLELAPRQLKRTFTLAEASRLVSEFGARSVDDLAVLRPQLRQDDATDIPDPIGRDPEFFNRIGVTIAESLRPVMELFRESQTTP